MGPVKVLLKGLLNKMLYSLYDITIIMTKFYVIYLMTLLVSRSVR